MAAATHPLIVCIVDDDPSVRIGLERLMRSAGHRADVYESGDRFLCSVDPTGPNCVVLDISMPGLSGLQVQEQMFKRAMSIPVIALSAREDDETRRLARSLGARFFLRKPVDAQALLDAIDWVTGADIRRPPPFGGNGN
jgi:FixJ family two-component response regulator